MLVLLVGVVVRLGPFLAAPALYLDEAMLALDLATRHAIGLLRPLDFEQSAPIIYLWLSRAALVMGGVNEWMLRLVPLLSGILLPWAVWSLARRLLSARAALLAAAIVALSPLAVWYANVAKPYALDALVATLLLLAAVEVRDSNRKSWWIALTLGGALAPFVSAPSVFVLAGVLVALVPGRSARGGGGLPSRYVLLVASVAIGSAVNYLLFQRRLGGEGYLLRFHQRAFLWPLDGALPGRFSEMVSGFTQFFYYGRPIHVPAVLLIATLAVTAVGLAALHRRWGATWTALAVTPVCAMLGAAVLRKYPVVERLALFLAPIAAVLLAAGVERLVERWIPRWRTEAFAIASSVFLLPSALTDTRNVIRPHGDGAEVRPMLAAYAAGREPGDPVYLYARAVPIWAFYTTDWSHPDLQRVAELTALARRIGPNSGNAPSRGRPVQHEGFDLVVRAGDHVELVGAPSGIEILYTLAMRLMPDSGWADNEVERMRNAGGEHIWVFLTHHSTAVETDLQAAIVRAGGTIEGDWRRWAVRLWRIRFPRPGSPG